MPGRSRRAGGGVLEGQHDLEQRVVRERPGRVECLDEALEGHILVGVTRPERDGPHPGQQARVNAGSPERSVRSTRVLTKKPTRSSKASSVRPAIGAADRDIGAGAQLASRAA